MKTVNERTTEYDIKDLFLERYSSRAMSGELVFENEVMTLLDAARWAPSAFNAQPWRFLYAVKGTSDFDLFFSFLKEGNQVWCKNAGALLIVLSKKNMDDGKPNPWHSFDTGSAFENLALQGSGMNLVIHPMAGFNSDILEKDLEIKDDYRVEIMIAVGKRGNVEDLPEDLRKIEKPKGRKDLNEISFKGKEGAKKL